MYFCIPLARTPCIMQPTLLETSSSLAILKKVVASSSKTTTNYQSTQHHIPNDLSSRTTLINPTHILSLIFFLMCGTVWFWYIAHSDSFSPLLGLVRNAFPSAINYSPVNLPGCYFISLRCIRSLVTRNIVISLPRWWLHLIVVRRFEYASDPESYTSGSVATGRVSLAGLVKG